MFIEKSSLFLSSRAFLNDKEHRNLFQQTNDVMDLTSYIIENENSGLQLKVHESSLLILLFCYRFLILLLFRKLQEVSFDI